VIGHARPFLSGAPFADLYTWITDLLITLCFEVDHVNDTLGSLQCARRTCAKALGMSGLDGDSPSGYLLICRDVALHLGKLCPSIRWIIAGH
jgi:hypothetical protein